MDQVQILSEIPAIPHSNVTVDIAIIDTTTRTGNVVGSHYLAPANHYPALQSRTKPTPSYSFLIYHEPSRINLLFDLGLRVDWKTSSSPAILHWVRDNDMHVSVDKDVATILQDGGVDPSKVDAVIFSHQHFDHTGDTRRFSDQMKIVVGPGFKRTYLPGWPAKKKNWETTSDLYHGREVQEISFSLGEEDSKGKYLQIGGFQAYDYFDDGSFYLLNTPGHTVGHISALARTTTSSTIQGNESVGESTFIFLGGDIAHNCALFRPNTHSHLPDVIHDNSMNGSSLASIHRMYNEQDGPVKARQTPFCTSTGPHHDIPTAQKSIDLLATFDGMDNIFTILSHDPDLLTVVDFFPQTANSWRNKGWRQKSMWKFLQALTGMDRGEGIEKYPTKAKI